MTTPLYAARGSRRWLQILVDQHSHLLRAALGAPLGLQASDGIDWQSPRRSEGFREYRDMAALRRVGVSRLSVRALSDF